jgi:hypothetical protein
MLRSTIFYKSRDPGRILIDTMKIVDEAVRKYFESLVAYRVASIVSMLTAYQVGLMTRGGKMTPEEMDVALDELLEMQKRVEGLS